MIDPRADLLAAQTLLYASGELDESQADCFERLLSRDQGAREALSRAAQVVQAADWQRVGKPHPGYRQRVRERLQAQSWFAWLWDRRLYRGHPAFWAGLGAAATILLMVFHGPAKTTLTPLAVQEHQVPFNLEEVAFPPPGEEWISLEQAEFWSNLPRAEHLHKLHQEQQRRRQLDGKLNRLDENRKRTQGEELPAF